MVRHDELRDGGANLVSKAFTPMHVHYYPKINAGSAVRGGKYKLKGSPLKDKGGDEGGYPHQKTQYAGDGQYSRHACHKYQCHLLSGQKPKKCLETSDKDKKKN